MAEHGYRTALIVGVGSGAVRLAGARVFNKAGIKVALAARRAGNLADLAKETAARRLPATPPTAARWPSCSPSSTKRSARRMSSSTMPATARADRSSTSIRPKSRRSIAVTAFGGFLVAQEAAKRMLPRGHGAILFTGASASVKGYAQSAPFAMGKFALRGLAQSMARELSPQGIHVAHVVIDGGIRSPTPADPAGQARQHARSGCHRADLSGSAAATAQRLGLGDRVAALGREILKLVYIEPAQSSR